MADWPHGSGEMAERIRGYDWAATPLGPVAGWPPSLRNAVDLMLGSPQFTTLAWGPALTLFYNDACAALLGTRHPAALGRSYTDVWRVQGPGDVIGTVLGGRSTHYVDQFFETPSRLDRPVGWFTGSRTPVRDESGAVAGFYVTGFETTDRVLAERAQHEREAQQVFLLRLSDALRPLAEPAAILGEACRHLGEHLDTDHAYYLDIREAEGLAVIEQDHARNGVRAFVGVSPLAVRNCLLPLYRRGRPVVVADLRASDMVREPMRARLVADGIVAWVAIPLVKRGELVGALCVVEGRPRAWSEAEVALVAETGERIWAATERARAETSAREADARMRTMADAAPVLIWDVDAAGTVFVNDHYLAFFGVRFERITEQGWSNFLHPDDAAGYLAVYEEAFAERRPFTHEARMRRADGQYRWLSHSGRPLGADRYVGVSIDVTERHQAEARLKRNNAVLQAINRIFSATLGAASEEDLADIAVEVAAQLTGSAFGFMGEIDAWTGRLLPLGTGDGRRGDGRDRAVPLARAERSLYGPILRDGRGLTLNDPAPDAPLDGAPEDHPPLTAFLGVPLKQGETTTGLIGLANRPGGYRPEDLEAAEALAPAIRHALLSKRGEARLRESEARFRQFAQASSDILWITDAETFAPEFASPALKAIYGLAPEDILGDARRWAAHVVPEDRAATFAQMERVRGGEAAVYEFRILRPSDRAFRWIRNHGFPLFDEEGRVRRIGGISSDVTEMRQAELHQRVLLAELQHRVRNIMALIRSIVVRSAHRAESVDDYAALLGGRLVTLARVQSRLTRAANAGVAISAILRDEIGALAERDDQYDLDGAEIELAPKAAEVLTLAIHELTTNAIKHGALSDGRGRVSVRWHRADRDGTPWLHVLWSEHGGPTPPAAAPGAQRRRGFGSELIEGMIPYELGGSGLIELTAEGARCRLEFPLSPGASILETHAPHRAGVFGGSLDTAGEADLAGHRILVAEDDFYLATDTARALAGVGAAVVGPYAAEGPALESLAREAPTGAVVDINLGGGPSFALARALAASAVPFVFVTGYEAAAIPPEFAEVPRLEKPVELRRIVCGLARVLAAPLNPA